MDLNDYEIFLKLLPVPVIIFNNSCVEEINDLAIKLLDTINTKNIVEELNPEYLSFVNSDFTEKIFEKNFVNETYKITLKRVSIHKGNFIMALFESITSYKNLEKLYVDTKYKMDLVLDNMPVMLDAQDENKNFIFWNKEWEKVSGYNSDEVINIDNFVKTLIPKMEYVEELQAQYKEYGYNVYNCEYKIQTKSGEEKTICGFNIGSVCKIPGWKYWSLGIDITERKKLERELIKTKDELQSIINAFPDLYFYFDYDRTILEYKSSNSSDLYASPDIFIGKKLYEILPADVSKLYCNAIKNLSKTKSMQTIEYSLIIDNSLQYFEARLLPHDKDKVIAIVRNITVQEIAEQNLKKSEESFKTFFNLSPYYAFALDITGSYVSQGNVIFLNRLGITLNELSNVNFNHFIDTKYIPSYRHTISLINCAVDVPPFELKLKDINEDEFYMEISFIPKFEKGQLIEILCFAKDITDNKKMIELKKESEENIKLLNEIKFFDKIRTEFFANISHEFRTPLNVILGSIQLIEKYLSDNTITDETNKLYKYNKIMKQNCYRILRLINNLIDVTKIDAGYLNLNIINCNIISIIEDITLSVAEYVKSKNLNIIFDTEVEEINMACDPDKIERIILNLLSNSIKFTQPGGSIFVNIYSKKDKVSISIKDTGQGIPEDKLEMIFERFRQVNKSLTRENEGSGIGLSLVKSLVELHSGTIEVKSKLGFGSEFIITLPVKLVASNPKKADLAAEYNFKEKIERINIEFSDIY